MQKCSHTRAASSDSGRVFWLDVARVVAIISITLNHAVNRSYDNYTNQIGEFLRISTISTLIKTLVTVFSRIGVPLFLMISGALLLKKTFRDEKDLRKFYRHNLWGMFITCEIWLFIMYWVNLFASPGAEILAGGPWSVLKGLCKTLCFIDQLTMGSMWYMPMILCLYLLIPFLAMLVQRFSLRVLLLPLGIVYLSSMVFPCWNGLYHLLEVDKSITFHLSSGNLFSIYFIYVILGYWISCGGLKKLPTWLVAFAAVGLFAAICGYQYWAYSCTYDYLAAYDFPLMPLCAGAVFEWIRRCAHWVKGLRRPVTYLSEIAFGIYFVHIVIMELIVWNIDLSFLMRPVQLALLEAVSFGGAVAVIALLSRIPWCKQYLFMIKDGKKKAVGK